MEGPLSYLSLTLWWYKSLLSNLIGAMVDTCIFSSLLYTIYTPVYPTSRWKFYFLWGTTFAPALVHVIWVTLMLTVLLRVVERMEAWDPGPPIRILAGDDKLRDGDESQAETMKPSLEFHWGHWEDACLGVFCQGCQPEWWKPALPPIGRDSMNPRMKPIKWKSEERDRESAFWALGPVSK